MRFVTSETKNATKIGGFCSKINNFIVLNSKMLVNTTENKPKKCCVLCHIDNLLPSVRLTYANSPHCHYNFCLQNFTNHIDCPFGIQNIEFTKNDKILFQSCHAIMQMDCLSTVIKVFWVFQRLVYITIHLKFAFISSFSQISIAQNHMKSFELQSIFY